MPIKKLLNCITCVTATAAIGTTAVASASPLAFNSAGKDQYFQQGTLINQAKFVDLNNDKKADMIGYSSFERMIFYRLANQDGASFGTEKSFPLPANALLEDFIVQDFNNDNRPDIATVLRDSNPENKVLVYSQDEKNQFSANVASYTVGRPNSKIAVGDINSDNRPDLVALSSSDQTFSILLASTTVAGTFSQQLTTDPITPSSSFILDDVNKDGKLDIVTTSSQFENGVWKDQLIVATGDGTGHFTAQQPRFSLPFATADIKAADLDGDGNNDYAIGASDGQAVSVILTSGSTLQSPKIFPLNTPVNTLYVDDINSDKRNDILIGQYQGITALTNTGDQPILSSPQELFTDYTDISNGILIEDMNNDGLKEIVFSSNNYNQNPATARLSVFYNKTELPPAPPTTNPSTVTNTVTTNTHTTNTVETSTTKSTEPGNPLAYAKITAVRLVKAKTKKKSRKKKYVVKVTVQCPVQSPAGCSGKLSVAGLLAKRKKARQKRVIFARGSFSLKTPSTKVVTLKVNKKALAKIVRSLKRAKLKKKRLTIIASSFDSRRPTTAQSKTVKLKLPRRLG